MVYQPIHEKIIRNLPHGMEQMNGFEPSLSAWKANVLTIEHYICKRRSENTRIELAHLYMKSYILCVRWFTKLLQVLVYLRLYQTDWFSCLLFRYHYSTSFFRLKEGNNSTNSKTSFNFKDQRELTIKLNFLSKKF